MILLLNTNKQNKAFRGRAMAISAKEMPQNQTDKERFEAGAYVS